MLIAYYGAMKSLAFGLIIVQALACHGDSSGTGENSGEKSDASGQSSRLLNLVTLSDGFDATSLEFSCIAPKGCDITLDIMIERHPLEDTFPSENLDEIDLAKIVLTRSTFVSEGGDNRALSLTTLPEDPSVSPTWGFAYHVQPGNTSIEVERVDSKTPQLPVWIELGWTKGSIDPTILSLHNLSEFDSTDLIFGCGNNQGCDVYLTAMVERSALEETLIPKRTESLDLARVDLTRPTFISEGGDNQSLSLLALPENPSLSPTWDFAYRVGEGTSEISVRRVESETPDLPLWLWLTVL